MASSRNEIRVGAITAASTAAVVGGRVPAGRRWNLNIIATNPTAGALTLTAAVLNKHHQYDQGRNTVYTTTVAAGNGQTGDIHPGGRWIAVGSIASTIVAITQINPPTVIGSKEQQLAAGVGNITSIKFSPDGNWLAVSGVTTPFIKVYSFNELYGVGLAVSNPATLPNGAVAGISWHPAGTYLACSYQGVSGVLSAWPWAPGFGAKLADSSSMGAAQAVDRVIEFRPQGDAIVAGFNGGANIAGWPFTNAFGTRFANPATLPAGRITGFAWAPGGGALAYGEAGSAAFQCILWSAGFGATFSIGSFGAAAGAAAVFAVDDYAFIGINGGSATGGWWNPLGVVGTPMQIIACPAAHGNPSPAIGVLLDGGLIVYGGQTISQIIFLNVAATPAISGGIANICSALSIPANSTKQLPGYVMNEGERLIVSGSGALDIYVSAVEVIL